MQTYSKYFIYSVLRIIFLSAALVADWWLFCRKVGTSPLHLDWLSTPRFTDNVMILGLENGGEIYLAALPAAYGVLTVLLGLAVGLLILSYMSELLSVYNSYRDMKRRVRLGMALRQ